MSATEYPWQQFVLDVFTAPTEFLPAKINAAERAIAARNTARPEPDAYEKLAIRDALNALKVLIDETKASDQARRDAFAKYSYPWQRLVLDAFTAPTESLPEKINAAERAIAARLQEPQQPDVRERVALGDALRALRVLVEETKPKQVSEPLEKKHIA